MDKEEYARRQGGVVSKPRLVTGGEDEEDDDGPRRRGSAVGRASSFGQRLRHGNAEQSSAKSRSRDDGILSARRTKDGGMEMSFVPKAGGGQGDDNLNVDYVAQDKKGQDDGKKPGDKRVERFAAGLEKGGYRGSKDGQREMTEEERKGRTGRRHPGRSASKNVFRGL